TICLPASAFSKSTSIVSPSATRYCRPPVLMIAKAIRVILSGEKAGQNHTNAPVWQTDNQGAAVSRPPVKLSRRLGSRRSLNQQHDLAFRRMRLVMCE